METLTQSGYGHLGFDGNELFCDSTNADPPKYRLGAVIQPGCSGGGAISFDAIRDLAHLLGREEMVMFHGEQAQEVRANPTDYTGSFSGHFRDSSVVTDPNDKNSDQMVKCFEMQHNRLWINPAWVQCLRELLGSVPPPPGTGGFPNKIVSPDGHVELDIQNADALGLVAYVDGRAFWSAEHGWIRR